MSYAASQLSMQH